MGTNSGHVASERVAALTAREEEVFRSKRARSRELWQEAQEFIPAGVPSSFQDTPPQPVFIDHGLGQQGLGRRRQRVRRLSQRVRRHGRRPRPSRDRRRSRRAAASRDALRAAGRGEHRRRARAGPAVPSAAVAFHQQRHRVDARRGAPRARLHRSRGDHQDRGVVPRPPRRAARVGRAAGRRCMGDADIAELGADDRRHPGVDGRADDRRRVQRSRQDSSARSPRIRVRSRA